MTNKSKFLGRALILLTLTTILIFTGCASPTPTEPTPDANMIFTQAAETVQAQLTKTALAMPTATSTPMPEPTATTEPSVAVEPTSEPQTEATQAVAVESTFTATPILETATTVPNPNKMEFVADVTIPDGTLIAAGSPFTKTWKIKNTGSTTWTTNFLIRHWAGEKLGANDPIPLNMEVAPNTEIEISIDFTAPLVDGEYLSMWILSDEDEANFGVPFYVKFNVGNPPTATPTATVEATVAPTEAPTEEPTPEPTATP